MPRLPYYPMHPEDFDTSDRVVNMSLAEVGLYILAINSAWRYGYIPDDPDALALKVQKRVQDVRKAWPVVRLAFVDSGTPGRLTNIRVEQERAKAIDKSEKSANAARIKHASAGASASPPAPIRAFGVLRSSEIVSEEKEAMYERYHEFVESWPSHNRRGVDFGAKVWIAYVDSGEISEEKLPLVYQGLERWKASDQWKKDGGKFIPAIADPERHGWLQKRAWKDLPRIAQGANEW